jgi:hypothetical protein
VKAATRVHLSACGVYNPARFDFLRLTPGGRGEWGEIRFSIGIPEGPVDAWFVFEGVDQPQTATCPPENVVLLTAEPSAYKYYPAKWLQQFGRMVTCQREQSYHPRKSIGFTGIPWWVGRSYDELIDAAPPKKSRRMSAIATRKRVMLGQSRRTDFLDALKERFGDRIDFFGRDWKPIRDKWEGLAGYEYSLAIENGQELCYWTEKISDCFLADCVPLYYGAPNIGDYFPDRSYVPIDIENRDQAFGIVERLLSRSDHRERETALREARLAVLREHNLFRLMTEYARDLDAGEHSREVTIVPEPKLSLLPRRWLKWKRRHLGRMYLRNPPTR